MCLSPVSIINPSKYVSLKFRDRYILQVPCNHCAECQEKNSAEWLYRAYFEFKECLSAGGFVAFDTLTYSEENLPYLSDIAEEFPHVPCFRTDDITKFLKRLRITLDRKYNDVSIRYFISSEYGSKFGRPHYHILFFVYGNINAVTFSHLISSSWKLGRTDGIPFKSGGYVLMHNTITSNRTADILSASNYVTKYVQKDCYFQGVLDKRIKYCDLVISNDKIPFVKSKSVAASRLRQKIKSEVNQFHVQSLGFGASALRDMDINSLMRDGFLRMPSRESVFKKVSIPIYYKRKLFYERCEVDRSILWQLNDDGKAFVRGRADSLKKLVSDRYKCIGILLGLNYDFDSLADYVLNYRGRYKGTEIESENIVERLENISLYNYVTRSDKDNIGVGLSVDFLGNSFLGYTPLTNFIPLKKFVAEHVFFDEEKEAVLQRLFAAVNPIDIGKQEYYKLKQRLQALFKSINK